MLDLSFHEVDEAHWADFARLFEAPGEPKSCWCMVWRTKGAATQVIKGPQRKVEMERRVRSGVPIGILA